MLRQREKRPRDDADEPAPDLSAIHRLLKATSGAAREGDASRTPSAKPHRKLPFGTVEIDGEVVEVASRPARLPSTNIAISGWCASLNLQAMFGEGTMLMALRDGAVYVAREKDGMVSIPLGARYCTVVKSSQLDPFGHPVVVARGGFQQSDWIPVGRPKHFETAVKRKAKPSRNIHGFVAFLKERPVCHVGEAMCQWKKLSEAERAAYREQALDGVEL